MRRKLRNTFAIISFTAFVALALLFARSYFYVDELGLGADKDRTALRLTIYTAYSSHGTFQFNMEHVRFVDEARSPNTVRSYFGTSFQGLKFSINAMRDSYLYRPKSAADELDMTTWLGFGVKRMPLTLIGKGDIEKAATYWVFPMWPPLLLTSIAPALVLRSYLRNRRRLASGHCQTCNYDLRAHIAGEICPECGTPVPQQTRKSQASAQQHAP